MACLGLYGLLTFAVTARTRELGVRAALGATPGALISLVLRNGLLLTLAGVAAGLLLSAATVRLLQSFLYGVNPLDLSTFAGATLVLLFFTVAAALLPARRAAALDPIEALRMD